MIVQGTGEDITRTRRIGVTVKQDGTWRVCIDSDSREVGPGLLTQDEAELIARWLRKTPVVDLRALASPHNGD